MFGKKKRAVDAYDLEVTLRGKDGKTFTERASALDVDGCGQDGVAGAVAKEALERNPGAKHVRTVSKRTGNRGDR
ncbi:hypothetical protein FNQ90_23415 [Streptomyces alkaliphilus]|uniref:Uncharacterized protein n=1 Tax=Streptomyces alkaliphilus TaxID=1472722 RepID=A0A7W3TI96_9ACTN|nr:hypothetical protein [Streptomyces alkaliphilus]MBB0246990.1 hypothetical protein [Streptomyces alkaliphilus]